MDTSFYIRRNGVHSMRMNLTTLAKNMPLATASAMKTTLDYTATRIVREVTSEYTVKRKDIIPTMKKVHANPNSLYAYITSVGRQVPLGRFVHTPRKYNPRTKNVKVKVKRQGGYKVVTTEPKAFVQEMGGQSEILRRKDSRRMPVYKLRSLSIPQMISNEEVIARITRDAEAKLKQRIDHEIKWRLNKAAKKAAKNS